MKQNRDYYMDAPLNDDGVSNVQRYGKNEEVEKKRILDEINNKPLTFSSHDVSPLMKGSKRTLYGNEYADYGSSQYDKDIDLSQYEYSHSAQQEKSLNNLRGELQSGWAQLGNSTLKGAALAGTTFVDGTLGTLAGVMTAIGEGRISGLWDNVVSNSLSDINNTINEEYLPNYQTKEEEEAPWYDRMFTANFVGENLIKNTGFMIGSAGVGKVAVGAVTGLAKATQLANKVNTMKTLGLLKNKEVGKKLVGATASAMNEARLEAIDSSKEWFEKQKFDLDQQMPDLMSQASQDFLNEHPEYFKDVYNPETGETERRISEEGLAMIKSNVNKEYEDRLAKLSELRLEHGNTTFAMNLPMLTMSDWYQFGKIYAPGFSKGRKAIANRVKGSIQDGFEFAKRNKAVTAGRLLSKGLVEGNEEMMQSAIGETSDVYTDSKYNSFINMKNDPEATDEVTSLVESMVKAVGNTYSNIDNYEEFISGTISALIGVPTFRSPRKQGGGFQSPVKIEGGMYEDWKAMKIEDNEFRSLVTDINERIKSEDFQTLHKGLVRSNALEEKMNDNLMKGDSYEFKNNENSQLVSDLLMFHALDKVDELYEFNDSMSNIVDVNEFKEMMTNQETGKSPYDGMTDEEIVESVKTKAADRKEKLVEYKKLIDRVENNFGDILSRDAIEEMVWLNASVDNSTKRFKQIHEELSEHLRPYVSTLQKMNVNDDIINSINTFLETNPNEQLTLEFLNNLKKKTTSEEFNSKINENIKKAEDNLEKSQELLPELNPEKKYVQILKDNITRVQSIIEQNRDLLDVNEDIYSKSRDMSRLVNDIIINKKKLSEYNQNPQKLEEYVANEKSSIEKARLDEIKQDTINDINRKSNNIKSFNQQIDNVSPEQREEILNEMMDEENNNYNPLAKEYTERKKVKDWIDNSKSIKESNDLYEEQFGDKENPPTNISDIAKEIINNNLDNNDKSIKELMDEKSFEISDEIKDSVTQEELDKAIELVNKIADDYKESSDFNKQVSKTYNANPEATGFSMSMLDSLDNANENKQKTSNEEIDGLDLGFNFNIGTSLIDEVDGISKQDKEQSFDNKDNSDTTKSKEDVTTIVPTKEQKDNKPKIEKQEIKEIPTSEVIDNNKKQAKQQSQQEEIDRKSNNVVMHSGLYEIDVEHYDKTLIVTDNSNPVTKEAHDYLTQKGAFKYVNEGNIKEGDAIYVIYDPDYVNLNDWNRENKPLLLAVKKKNGETQIVGTFYSGYNPQLHKYIVEQFENQSEELVEYKPTSSKITYVNQLDNNGELTNESNEIVPTYSFFQIEDNGNSQGNLSIINDSRSEKLLIAHKDSMLSKLADIEEQSLNPNKIIVVKPARVEKNSNGKWIIKEKAKLIFTDSKSGKSINKNKQEIFFPKDENGEDVFTNVSMVTPGKIGFTNEMGNVSDRIDTSKPIILGVMDDTNNINTNGQQEINPPKSNEDMHKSGRVYLGIKNARGTLIPVELRMNSLSKINKESKFYKALQKVLSNLIENVSDDNKFYNTIDTIKEFLYINEDNSKLKIFTKEGQIDVVITEENGKVVRQTLDLTKDKSDIIKDLLDIIESSNVLIQIDKNQINSDWNYNNSVSYNNMILEAGILQTNLQLPYVRGAYFYMNPLFADESNSGTTTITKDNNKIESKAVTPPTQTKSFITDGINGTKLVLKDHTFYITSDNKVLDNNQKLITDSALADRIRILNYLNNLTQEQKDANVRTANGVGYYTEGDIAFTHKGYIITKENNPELHAEIFKTEGSGESNFLLREVQKSIKAVTDDLKDNYNELTKGFTKSKTTESPKIEVKNEDIKPSRRERRSLGRDNEISSNKPTISNDFDNTNSASNEVSQRKEINETKDWQDKNCK